MNFDIEIDFSRCSHLLWFLLWIIFNNLVEKDSSFESRPRIVFLVELKTIDVDEKEVNFGSRGMFEEFVTHAAVFVRSFDYSRQIGYRYLYWWFNPLFICFYSTFLVFFILTFRLSSYSMIPTCGFIVVTFLFIWNS